MNTVINKLCNRNLLVRTIANFFIFFCVCRSIFMCWPFAQQLNPRAVLRPLNSLSNYWGLNADLSLFSPHLPGIIDEVKFVVTFEDGTTQDWKFPREKILPWDSEGSYRQSVRNALLWKGQRSLKEFQPEVARYIFRQISIPNKHAVRVDFLRGVTAIPLPQEGIGKPLAHAQQYETFYSYTIQPGDLN